MKTIYIIFLTLFITGKGFSQSADEAIKKVKARLEKVNDYQAVGKMKTNVIFIKAPIANIKVYYKRPDKLRINNEQGISFVPKGSVNINLNNVFLNTEGFDIIDMGKEAKSGFRIIKLLPRDENSDVVLSTLHIDEVNGLVMRARTTTRDNGTYELQMSYGRYADFGLADKVILEFNTKEYKLPKGVTFDYDDGSKKPPTDKMNNKKGKVEIVYTSYTINKGVSDSVFK
ncbi:MAG: hypothetical protein IPQ08_07525 [Chitinophagaceae bacterium]|nr:hypothetical protein [Chitinophagaceae bacterium]